MLIKLIVIYRMRGKKLTNEMEYPNFIFLKSSISSESKYLKTYVKKKSKCIKSGKTVKAFLQAFQKKQATSAQHKLSSKNRYKKK